MAGFWIRWGINAFGIWAASSLIPGIRVQGWIPLLLAAALWGIVNALLRPLLILLTLPLNILTLGLFTLVINGILFGLVSLLIPDFEVQGLGPAVLGALVVSLISWVLNRWIR
jgi:putative membrane protein